MAQLLVKFTMIDPPKIRLLIGIKYTTDEAVLNRIDEGAMELVDSYSRTPLIHAAIWGRTSLVKRILGMGGVVDHLDVLRMTALHYAVQEMHIEVVEILLAAGADPNIVDVHGNSPLWRAVMQSRDPSICLLLLQHGALCDGKNAVGRSPRDLAMTQSNDIVLAAMHEMESNSKSVTE
jgi:ankyrin repeat protein